MSDTGGSGGHQGAPAGWYLDPTGQPRWRWWTGGAWTDHVAPLTVPAQGRSGPQLAAAVQLQNAQARLDRFVVVGVWVVAAVGIIGLVASLGEIDYYRSLWHWFHELFHAAGQGETLPRQPSPPHWRSFFTLLTLGVLVVEIFMLIWQHRAASAARALGYPARHSAGWGVGCWFVPVVNFWMPYQAIRDCLPPDHPAGRRVLDAWLLYVGSNFVLGPAGLVALATAPTLGVVLVLLDIVAKVAMALNAAVAARAIASDHRDAVGAAGSVRPSS